jgi:hypothetical protein
MSGIMGRCEKCGHVFDVLLGFNCPACVAWRTERVREAFAPIDPLRTALGIHGLREDAELDGVWHWHGDPGEFYRKMQHREEYPGRLCAPNENQAEVPRGCKMPTSEEAQVYELKRRFRL